MRRSLLALLAWLPLAAAAQYYDCRSFDDKALCKLLNRYPAVKDLPVIEVGRVQALYRDKRDYAEDLLEDRPWVLRGQVASVTEKAGRVMVMLSDGGDPVETVQLQLFASHPVAAQDGRVGSRSVAQVAAMLRVGEDAVFQCVGAGRTGKQPVFRHCVLWK